jgi:DNA-binding XRE family transcriptional regulator
MSTRKANAGASEAARLLGQLGGRARSAKLSAERLREIGVIAAKARHAALSPARRRAIATKASKAAATARMARAALKRMLAAEVQRERLPSTPSITKGSVAPRTLSTVIRELREARQLTQAELAKRAGVTQPYIGHLESGLRKNPSLPTLKKLAQSLGVSVTELLG